MSDRTFELSLTGGTLLILAGAAAAIILGPSPSLAVVAGLLVEVLMMGTLLYYWGRAYMAK